jgi:DNA-nicking Smr family endonuclease
MKELDLHGVVHEEVERLVENFILLNQDDVPLRIVTGKSSRMSQLVMSTAARIKCDRVDSFFEGYVLVHKV